MKAITFDHYGSTDVLELRDVDIPNVGDDGVLIRVHAAAINPCDWHFMTGLPYFIRLKLGLRRPKVSGLGADLAGQVEAVGPNVSRVRPGDDVYGRIDLLPGSDQMDLGAVAEYVRVNQDSVRPTPGRLTAEEAAAVPLAGLIALWAMRDAGSVQPGHHVLLNGASGGVGTFAVQIATAMGTEVTAVQHANVDLVRSLGADHVVDYTREDIAQGGPRFDLMLDNVGNHSPTACPRMLRPAGTYLLSFDHPWRRRFGPMGFAMRMSVRSPPTSSRRSWCSPNVATRTWTRCPR